jgi:hypothetical protein
VIRRRRPQPAPQGQQLVKGITRPPVMTEQGQTPPPVNAPTCCQDIFDSAQQLLAAKRRIALLESTVAAMGLKRGAAEQQHAADLAALRERLADFAADVVGSPAGADCPGCQGLHRTIRELRGEVRELRRRLAQARRPLLDADPSEVRTAGPDQAGLLPLTDPEPTGVVPRVSDDLLAAGWSALSSAGQSAGGEEA